MNLSISLLTKCRKIAVIIGYPCYACASKKRTEGMMMAERVDKGCLRQNQTSSSHINSCIPSLLWLYDFCNSVTLNSIFFILSLKLTLGVLHSFFPCCFQFCFLTGPSVSLRLSSHSYASSSTQRDTGAGFSPLWEAMLVTCQWEEWSPAVDCFPSIHRSTGSGRHKYWQRSVSANPPTHAGVETAR